jgi:hypothetical protein
LKPGHAGEAPSKAAHGSPRRTKRYDRAGDEIMLDEVERIAILKRSTLAGAFGIWRQETWVHQAA